MDLRLLGPVQWRVPGGVVDLGPARQRTVFAALLVDAGCPVPTEVLIDRVWGEEAPAGARSGLYSYITRLRRVLIQAGGELALVYERGGYVLHAAADRVDLHRFRRLVQRARDCRGDDEQRAAALDEAIGLWHGAAMSDLAGPWVVRTRDQLAQQRIDAVLLWAEVLLRLGRGGEVIPTLRDLLAEHPLVEPLAARLIEALYLDGRIAEALDRYGSTRRRLVAELGCEPGPELRRLHETVLLHDATPAAVPPPAAATAATAAPAELPLDLFGFAGRRHELAVLDAILAESGEQDPAVAIAVLAGLAGVGKTALAVHWAHRLADRFPDGQLYVNLRGFAPPGSVTPAGEALRGFLEALQVPAQRIPATERAQAGLYRSRLAGKRVIVVLDNAATEEQVRPLLPGSPGCLVVVTSRHPLTGLMAAEGARPLALEPMPAGEARELLVCRLGARVAAEPDAVDGIVARCAGLPLALAIVAARATTRRLPLATLAAELHRSTADLEPFAGADPATDLRAVFSWSYRALGPAAARLFRLLGLHPGPDLGPAAAASLAGRPVADLQPVLDELGNAGLVTERAPGRYALHDLMRSYAHELAHDGDDADRRAARRRLLDHYVQGAHAADRLLQPNRKPVSPPVPSPGVTPVDPGDREQALDWFTAEHPALLALLRDEAARATAAGLDRGFDRHLWHLARALATFLDLGWYSADLLATHQAALDAARRLADNEAQAYAHRVLARAQVRLGDHLAAAAHHREADDLFGRTGDRAGEAHTRLDLAWALLAQGDRDEAVREARHALGLFRTAGNRLGQAVALNAVATCQTRSGDHDGALTNGRLALTLFDELDDSYGQADAWDTLGEAHHHLGHHQQAIAHYERAIDLYRHVGDRGYEAETLTRLGDHHQAAGRHDAAHRAWRQAMTIFDELDHPQAPAVRARLDRVDHVSAGTG